MRLRCFAAILLATSVSGCGRPAAVSPSAPAGTGRAPAAGATTCSRPPVAAGTALKVGVIPMGGTHDFYKCIHAGAVKAELELAGVQVIWKAPLKENDREAQVGIVENMINSGVAGIALVPTDNVALLKPVREAVRAGRGVVILDTPLDGEACTDFGSFVATDSYAGGQMAARRLGELLSGRGRILMMRCQVGVIGTGQREQGFLDAVAAEFPDLQVLSSDQYGGLVAEQAQAKAENLLRRFPELDGVFCPNESTTFGMLRALQSDGRAGRVKFVGFDSSEKLVAALAAGELHGLVLQDPVAIGYTGVKTLVAYLRGETVPVRIDTGCHLATPENMAESRVQELLSPPIGKYLP